MGTLFDQPPRRRHDADVGSVKDCFEFLKGQGFSPTLQDVLAYQRNEIELAKLSAMLDDCDVKDEQLAGFGELLQELSITAEDFKHE